MSSTITINSSAPAAEAAPRQLLAAESRMWTLNEMVQRRAAEMGDLTLIAYPNKGLLDFEEHSARSVDRYADAAAEKLQSLGLAPVVSTERSAVGQKIPIADPTKI